MSEISPACDCSSRSCECTSDDAARQRAIVANLIGVPWGEINCLTLAIRAHTILTGNAPQLTYDLTCDDTNIAARSQEILQHVEEYAYKVDSPQMGDFGLMRAYGSIHMYTFVSSFEIVHIITNSVSKLSQLTPAIQRRTIGFYRWR